MALYLLKDVRDNTKTCTVRNLWLQSLWSFVLCDCSFIHCAHTYVHSTYVCIPMKWMNEHMYWSILYQTLTLPLTCYTVLTLTLDFALYLQSDHPKLPARTVNHFQYTAWPDYQVPKYPASLVRFVQTVRHMYKDEGAPMVVHCRYVRTYIWCHGIGVDVDWCLFTCTLVLHFRSFHFFWITNLVIQ